MWTRPPAQDIDAWEELGNSGWNWSQYLKYSKKSEKWAFPMKFVISALSWVIVRFTPPSDELRDEFQLLYNISSHGNTGPLATSYAGLISAVDVPIKEVKSVSAIVSLMLMYNLYRLGKTSVFNLQKILWVSILNWASVSYRTEWIVWRWCEY